MQFRVSMKCPDALADSIDEAVSEEVRLMNLSDDEEQDAVAEIRKEWASDVCSKWFRYGEYLEVEIDTEAKTCIVVAQEG